MSEGGGYLRSPHVDRGLARCHGMTESHSDADGFFLTTSPSASPATYCTREVHARTSLQVPKPESYPIWPGPISSFMSLWPSGTGHVKLLCNLKRCFPLWVSQRTCTEWQCPVTLSRPCAGHCCACTVDSACPFLTRGTCNSRLRSLGLVLLRLHLVFASSACSSGGVLSA